MNGIEILRRPIPSPASTLSVGLEGLDSIDSLGFRRPFSLVVFFFQREVGAGVVSFFILFPRFIDLPRLSFAPLPHPSFPAPLINN